MRLTERDLVAWRARTATLDEGRIYWPFDHRHDTDEERYEARLAGYAWDAHEGLRNGGAPIDDALVAQMVQHAPYRPYGTLPALTDSCRVEKFTGCYCDGSCRRVRRG